MVLSRVNIEENNMNNKFIYMNNYVQNKFYEVPIKLSDIFRASSQAFLNFIWRFLVKHFLYSTGWYVSDWGTHQISSTEENSENQTSSIRKENERQKMKQLFHVHQH